MDLYQAMRTCRALRDLYLPLWQEYEKETMRASAGLTGDAAAKRDRTLAAADHLAEHFDVSPVVAVFCFDARRMAIHPAVQNMAFGDHFGGEL